jgi:hypothetical protein
MPQILVDLVQDPDMWPVTRVVIIMVAALAISGCLFWRALRRIEREADRVIADATRRAR